MHRGPVSDVEGCTSAFLGFISIDMNGKTGSPCHLYGCVDDHRTGLHAIGLGTPGSVGIKGCLGDFLKNAETRGCPIPRVHLQILPARLELVREKVAEGCPEHLLPNVTVEERPHQSQRQAVATRRPKKKSGSIPTRLK